MRIALLGGTGYIGGYLTDTLIAHRYHPIQLVRLGSEDKVRHREHCVIITGDVGDTDALRMVLRHADVVIYNIGIIREFPERGVTFDELHYQGIRRTVDLAVRVGIKRFILMSANGVHAEGTPYQRSKYMAEEYLKRSRLDWTIFRPSLVFGDPRGAVDFCTEVRDRIIRPPFPAPLFYRGLFPRDPGGFVFSPIHVSEVARACVMALTNRGATKRTWCLRGPDNVSWRTLLRMVARVAGQNKRMIPVPAGPLLAVVRALDGIRSFPVTADQIRMLLEGNVCDSSESYEISGPTRIRFLPDNLAYLKHT